MDHPDVVDRVPRSAPCLNSRDIQVNYGAARRAARRRRSTVAAGELVCVVGPNGAGKSTLINAIAGLHPVAAGAMTLDGCDLTRLPAHRFCAEGIADRARGPAALHRHDGAREPGARQLSPAAKAARPASLERVCALFPALVGKLDAPAGALSGGQQQMVAIARALMAQPAPAAARRAVARARAADRARNVRDDRAHPRRGRGGAAGRAERGARARARDARLRARRGPHRRRRTRRMRCARSRTSGGSISGWRRTRRQPLTSRIAAAAAIRYRRTLQYRRPAPMTHESDYLQIIANGLPPVSGKRKRVVIVGAGMAGLTAADELLRAGHDPLILEAQQRVGGRVYTLREPFAPGLYAEAGAMRIPRAHKLTLAYVEKFGLETIDFTMNNPDALVPSLRAQAPVPRRRSEAPSHRRPSRPARARHDVQPDVGARAGAVRRSTGGAGRRWMAGDRRAIRQSFDPRIPGGEGLVGSARSSCSAC